MSRSYRNNKSEPLLYHLLTNFQRTALHNATGFNLQTTAICDRDELMNHLVTSNYFWSQFPLERVASAAQEDLGVQETDGAELYTWM